MYIDEQKCTGCGFCMRDCPAGAVTIRKRKAVIHDASCTGCNVCRRVCEQDAVQEDGREKKEDRAVCEACPVKCSITPGYYGACRRYKNEKGRINRIQRLHTYADVKSTEEPETDPAIRNPMITGIGAGTTYPDAKPAPHIVSENRNGVDVVTVVTEVPLSYSSVILKIDTDEPVGKEGDPVLAGKREVGMIETEQYGSRMLHIGGVNRLTGKNGFITAKTVTDICNRKTVKLKTGSGRRLKVRVGEPPEINNNCPERMRVGCGSATLGMFAALFREAADEVIVLDAHITGQLSRHVAGKFAGVRPSRVMLKYPESTPGRYFGEHGTGWGGTTITNPPDIVDAIDLTVAFPGMTIFITETTGRKGIMFRVTEKGSLSEIPLSPKAKQVMAVISDACEPARVSAVYTGGVGGSARAGVTRYPVKLTRAVHSGQATLTVGGAPVFILPGGGITFMVDVEKVMAGAFYWTPTPATICPVEYTMKLEDYEKIGGHLEAVRPFSSG